MSAEHVRNISMTKCERHCKIISVRGRSNNQVIITFFSGESAANFTDSSALLLAKKPSYTMMEATRNCGGIASRQMVLARQITPRYPDW